MAKSFPVSGAILLHLKSTILHELASKVCVEIVDTDKPQRPYTMAVEYLSV